MRCKNCDAPVHGAYCAACGQRTSVAPLRFRELASRSFGELTSFEQPLLRTIKDLLLRPGHVARAYALGRRVRYTNPIKWALVCTALAFVVGRWIGRKPTMRLSLDTDDETPDWVVPIAQAIESNTAPLFVLLLLPVLALSLRWCFHGTGRTVAEQFVLVLYAYGLAALLQAALTPLDLLGVPTNFVGVLPLVWTAWAAVPFHPARNAWLSVLCVVLAHMLWIALLGAVIGGGVWIAHLLGLA